MEILKIDKEPKYVYIVGECRLRVTQGAAKVLGATLHAGQGEWNIFSPKSSSLLYISSAIPDAPVEVELESIDIFHFFIPKIFVKMTVEGKDPGIDKSYSVLADPNELQYYRLMDISPSYEVISEALSNLSSFRVVIVGERKVGKSTFCRYLLNSLLSSDSKGKVDSSIDFADFDCGQTEFTPPQTISVATFSGPKDFLLGPPFTHQHTQPSECRYLGFTSPTSNPMAYIEACRSLLSAKMHKHDHRMIVNTMGWLTGLGLELLTELIKSVKPTHLVFFQDGPRDGPFDRFVQQYTRIREEEDEDSFDIAYLDPKSILEPASSALSPLAFRFRPAEQRDLAMQAYFKGSERVAVPLKAIRILYTWKTMSVEDSLLAGRMVAFIEGSPENFAQLPEQRCIGLGIVVKKTAGILYLHTPVPLDVLLIKNIRHLAIGYENPTPESLINSVLDPESSDECWFKTPDYTSISLPFSKSYGKTVPKIRHNVKRRHK